MVEKNRYPQIPSTVWWGVRSILQRTPSAIIDERLLGVQLGVQEVAAKAYVNELKHVGIVTDEGRATVLAQKWRLDDSYVEAVKEIIQSVYPDSLVHNAPPGNAERQKVVSWFLREGLGQGAAGNKAATYLLLSSPSPNEGARPAPKTSQGESALRPTLPKRQGSTNSKVEKTSEGKSPEYDGGAKRNSTSRSGGEAFPLNVNVQIHISADAGTEQIESIFQAMRRYLYDAPNS